MDIKKLVSAHKKEKDRSVADRMPLIIFIQRDKMYTGWNMFAIVSVKTR